MRKPEHGVLGVVAARELHEEADRAVAREVADEDAAGGRVARPEHRDEPEREHDERDRLVELSANGKRIVFELNGEIVPGDNADDNGELYVADQD